MMNSDKIVASYWAKPIPDRRFDWVAHFDGQEEAGPYGYGATEGEAKDDLLGQVRDDQA